MRGGSERVEHRDERERERERERETRSSDGRAGKRAHTHTRARARAHTHTERRGRLEHSRGKHMEQAHGCIEGCLRPCWPASFAEHMDA